MQHEEIVSRLSKRMVATTPSEVVYSITLESILSAIVRRMGENALTLSTYELNQACEEVKDAINHNLDERDYIDMGLDAWEVVRKL